MLALGAVLLPATSAVPQTMTFGTPGAPGTCCHDHNGHDGGKGQDFINQQQPGLSIQAGGLTGLLVSTNGGNGGDGEDLSSRNHWGGNGGTAGQIGFTLLGSTIAGASSGVVTTANGGNGGFWAYSSDWGNGGAGATLSFSIDSSVIGAAQYGLSATSIGGTGQPNSLKKFSGAGGDRNAGNGANAGSVIVSLRNGSTLSVAAGSPGGAGIQALSQGGNGGNGDYSDGTSGHNRTGFGGNASDVNVAVDASSLITTTGDAVMGIVASSIGGNAGQPDSGPGGQSVHSSDGGNAGLVTITNAGRISTSGIASIALLGVGVGGDGGDGGSARGGSGYAGGNGGTPLGVRISNSGTLSTQGAYAHGILASVLGGNGGAGGSGAIFGGGGKGGSGSSLTGTNAVVIDNSGSITTAGMAAFGILGYAVGGGGGVSSASQGLIVVGATGGGGGSGGDVTVTNTGAVVTAQDHAPAILLHSIGGGGGVGGDSSSASVIASVAIGGQGGNGGSGGNASLTMNGGSIATSGANAAGVQLQSIGGGGGHGGFASAVSVGVGLGVAVATGGSGGLGGSAGALSLTLDSASSVTTQGSASSGVVAQAIGGGGGKGAFANSQQITIAPNLGDYPTGTVSVRYTQGGTGGGGGNGGTINVSTQGTITTNGANSHGIEAQSIGGGGGSGGAVGAPLRATTVGSANFNIDVGILTGGAGGSGGSGAAVTIANAGTIATSGTGSIALLSQSIGGGGGDGGIAQTETSDSFSSALGSPTNVVSALQKVASWLEEGPKLGVGTVTAGFSLSKGGSGGSGGTGGTVTTDNSGTLATSGAHAAGIVAQSIGGGGGSGGIAESTGASSLMSSIDNIVSAIANGVTNAFNVVPTANVNVSIGGSGGASGDGGAVTVTNSGTVSTSGLGSPAILAQSIGGGGGAGMTTSQTLASMTKPSGPLSGPGVLDALTDVINLISSNGFTSLSNVVQQVGGTGSVAGNGGAVTIGATADGSRITTAGANAPGILAQSIGGGGGLSATLQEYLISGSSAQQLIVGGSGSINGSGSTVQVTTGGLVQTTGANAIGIIAQSISGGGGVAYATTTSPLAQTATLALQLGTAGSQAGSPGTVTVTTTDGQIATTGALSHGILAQSIAGGGGIAAVAVDAGITIGNPSFRLGSFAALSGSAGTVTVNAGTISTSGDAAFGVLAQSIGGGGGYAAVVQNGGPLATWSTYGLGGGNNATSYGGTVNASLAQGASIVTAGRNAVGIFAQSIGGGGGVAGLAAVPGAISMAAPTSGVSSYGDGGAVSIDVEGQIRTTGAGAVGILAQSVGGGGGLVGDLASLSYGPGIVQDAQYTGSAGQGGAVTVTVNGAVSTQGASAPAILAMSAGSGAVLSDIGVLIKRPYTPQGNAGGNIAVNVGAGASVTASGANSPAIYAISIGNSGADNGQVFRGGDITVTVLSGGVVTGGSGDLATAITSWTPGTTYINNSGTLTALGNSPTDRTAILTAGGAVINNAGTISGNVRLFSEPQAAGAQAQFSNQTGAVFNAGYDVRLNVTGSGGQLANDGLVNPGGAGVFLSTRVSGDYVQSAGGTLALDLDFANRNSDVLSVSGATALAGTVTPLTVNPLKGVTLQIGQFDQAASGAGSLGIVSSSPVFSYTLSQPGPQTLAIGVDGNFTPGNTTLNANGARIASHLQSLWDAGYAPAAPLFGAFIRSTGASYAQDVGALASDAAHSRLARVGQQSRSFFDRMMSCPVFIDGGTRLGESDCVWGRVIGERTNRSSTFESSGYTSRQVTYQVGAQKEVVPDWFLGGSLAYTTARTETAMSTVKSSSDSINAGLVLKRQLGAWQFSAAVRGGHDSWDMQRNAALPGLSGRALSSPKAFHAGGRLRASYQIPFDGWYLKPIADLDLNYVRQQAYTETGAGLFNLAIAGNSQVSTTASLSMEVGARLDYSGFTLRPYATAGISFLGGGDWQSQARLASFAGNLAPFTLTTAVPKTYGNVSAGIELASVNGLELRAEYTLRAAKDYVDQSAALRMAFKF